MSDEDRASVPSMVGKRNGQAAMTVRIGGKPATIPDTGNGASAEAADELNGAVVSAAAPAPHRTGVLHGVQENAATRRGSAKRRASYTSRQVKIPNQLSASWVDGYGAHR